MNKRKIVMMALSIMMVAILAVGGSLAFLTDDASQTNTFTTGKVDIKLDENVPEKNEETGNLDKTETRTEENQEYKLFPGMTVAKDPTITVKAGSEDAYLGAIVTVKGDLYDLIGVSGYDTIDITKMASGGLMVNGKGTYGSKNGLTSFTSTDYTIYQKADKANNTWTLYVVINGVKTAGDKVVLFDTLTISDEYDNAEMAKLDGMTIEVDAYAAQADGFGDSETALVAAFEAWETALVPAA